jgi:hypothetical protein
MVRYFYAWTPLFFVGSIFILALPWLGLIALMIVAVVALPALTLAIVFLPYMLGRAISRRWHVQRHARPRAAAVPSPAARQLTSQRGALS